MIFARASAAMLERRSQVGSPIVSMYAAVHGTPPELVSGAPRAVQQRGDVAVAALVHAPKHLALLA